MFRPLLFVLPLAACSFEIHEQTDTTTLDAAYSDLRVSVDAGDVEIYPIDCDCVELEAVMRWSHHPPELDWTAEGDRLVVTSSCRGPTCSSDLRIGLPAGAIVDAETRAGDVEAHEMGPTTLFTAAGDARATLIDGELRAESDAGDVEVSEVSGDALLRTRAGDVYATGLDGDAIDAWSGAGDVDLFVRAAGSIEARSDAGDVALTVPGGAWRLELSSGAGDVETSGVVDDADADRRIDASSGAGDVVLIGTGD